MKILSCYFRENQGKFFGKRGTSLLGYMLIKNSPDPVAREKGLKDVKMVMLVTNDSLQCEHSVACTKHFIYTNHVKTLKVKYQSVLQLKTQPHHTAFLGGLDGSPGGGIPNQCPWRWKDCP
jgi:hypothetical protein